MKNCLQLVLVFLSVSTVAQVKNKPGLEYPVNKASEAIKLDGILDEGTWQRASAAGDFWVSRPVDTLAASNKTSFKIAFDEHFLYVAFECMEDGKEPIVQSLRRDFDFGPNDNVGIYIDTYNDFTNGFYFNITPYGVQREGTMANAGTSPDDYSSFWDNKWYSAVTRHSDKWVAEIAIPFKSIRYNADTWNFNVLRNDVERNQMSSWIATPIQYMPASFQNSGKMMWQEPLPKPGKNISFIPFLTTGMDQPNSQEASPRLNSDIGMDAKVAVTPSLNLDLTINPDFSNVEVDRQVINLTRFEINFPERRQFFLENTDLFATPGFMSSRPFFSRRIGLVEDSLGQLKQVPIQYGARLSGKLGKDWRLGLLNMQTKEDKALGLPTQNYTAAVVQRQIFRRSNIDFVFINKESLGLGKYDSSRYYHSSILREPSRPSLDSLPELNRFNRVIGSDFNLFTKSNRWNGDVYYFKSLDNFGKKNTSAVGAFLGYFSRNLNVFSGFESIGKNFNAEVGFVPQLRQYPGYRSSFFRIENPLYPKKSTFANITPAYGFNFNTLPDGRLTDTELSAEVGFLRGNTAGFQVSYSRIYQVLLAPFNPVSDKLRQYEIDEVFTWHETGLSYNSDTRKLLSWQGAIQYGTFYSGERLNVNGTINYRIQPFGSLSIDFDYNDIQLGSDYGNDDIFLLSPRLDFTFTDKLFLTTFVQVNSREDNINLYTRFQWRFKPASDFFVVYTENYLPEGLVSKNRALVLKLTYWFNL